MGLMCLYTGDWVYRSNEYYSDVCGPNIALDNDMLIHANSNVCLYIGTYGMRGSDAPTDWQSILVERDSYHVSEPEFLLILEMSITQRFLIDSSYNRLLGDTLDESSANAPVRAIEAIAQVNLDTTRLLMKLDAVRYSRFTSHRVMTQKTRESLHINEALTSLESKMQSIDTAMRSISDIKNLRNGNRLNTVLAAIAIASLLQILFMETTIPFLESLHIESSGISEFLIAVTFFLIVFSVATLAINFMRNRLNK
jgi:BMFP domain-containing protein YqiC